MELEIGVNSYVTIDEADEYIKQHYSIKSALYAHWLVAGDFTDPDSGFDLKTMYLLKSVEEIERLPFVGRKVLWTQALSFPRTLQEFGFAVRHSPIFMYYGIAENKVPPQVKAAQIENAIDGIIRNEYVPTKRAVAINALGMAPDPRVRGKLSSAKAEDILKPFLGTLKA